MIGKIPRLSVDQIMELIKPFVKYSKTYRTCSDSSLKNKIYDLWNEAASLRLNDFVVDDDDRSVQPVDTCSTAEVCDFCFADIENCRLACRQCLFPCCEDKEIATYSLLSVCFYEENHENLQARLRANDPESMQVQHAVWVRRLELAWKLHERANKTYTIVHEECVQCETPVSCLGHTTCVFDYKLFCEKCLFPLFVINNTTSDD
ncbi:AC52-like protein [Orgyia pseudotsugata single capsid nuclopolyhedrovirus]|nr:AC52-like protein [Orgyia pseudotsugata single capsid nuclopolyhedrovirus]